MTNKTAALRYARALLEVGVKQGAPLDRVSDDLGAFAALFDEHPSLGQVMLNPAVPVPRKRAAMAELVARAGSSPIVGKLLVLLAERDRLILLPDIVRAYQERLLEHQHVVRAEVTTATPIEPERTRAIERGLAGVTGRTVQMGVRTDPSIIGGLVARVGDTIYDGSIITQLEKMKKRLIDSM